MRKQLLFSLFSLAAMVMLATACRRTVDEPKPVDPAPQESSFKKEIAFSISTRDDYRQQRYDSSYGSLYLFISRADHPDYDSRILWDTTFAMRPLTRFQDVLPMVIRKRFEVNDAKTVLRWGCQMKYEEHVPPFYGPTSYGYAGPVGEGNIVRTLPVGI